MASLVQNLFKEHVTCRMLLTYLCSTLIFNRPILSCLGATWALRYWRNREASSGGIVSSPVWARIRRIVSSDRQPSSFLSKTLENFINVRKVKYQAWIYCFGCQYKHQNDFRRVFNKNLTYWRAARISIWGSLAVCLIWCFIILVNSWKSMHSLPKDT